MDSLYASSGNFQSEDLGSEYTLDLLNRFQLTTQEMYDCLDYAQECGLIPLCTPWDHVSLNRLNQYGVDGFKIASADLTNHALVESAARTGKPLLISTGMSTEAEIKASIAILKQNGASFLMLHCNSTYPAPLREINLAYMDRLKELSQGFVGYSGHERGFEVCLAAVARGAKVIEKHFTSDRNMEGNDHRVSLLPNEFKSMVKAIRNIEEALGSSQERTISQGEILNREVLAKSLVSASYIRKGEEITQDMVDICSPGRGLQPSSLKNLVGTVAVRDMQPGDFFFESDLTGDMVYPRNYRFDRPWGIPVRYHDFHELTHGVNMDLVEMHFSYRDLDLEPANYFQGHLELDLIVHSPELFAGDHIMDLSSDDDGYRSRSISELQRVVDCTRRLKSFFPRTKKPLVIINAGGYTLDHFMPVDKRRKLYARIGEALDRVDSSGVEIIPQTMPPFPWHFGGQRYHNLFVDPKEIVEFCETYNYRVCYDISHSKLACNYFKWSLHEFTRQLGKHIAHLHIVDASGHNSEGLQIGKGDIDFVSLGHDLREWAPGISFIPEIWQGHKNSGEGFWMALNRLENSLGPIAGNKVSQNA